MDRQDWMPSATRMAALVACNRSSDVLRPRASTFCPGIKADGYARTVFEGFSAMFIFWRVWRSDFRSATCVRMCDLRQCYHRRRSVLAADGARRYLNNILFHVGSKGQSEQKSSITKSIPSLATQNLAKAMGLRRRQRSRRYCWKERAGDDLA